MPIAESLPVMKDAIEILRIFQRSYFHNSQLQIKL